MRSVIATMLDVIDRSRSAGHMVEPDTSNSYRELMKLDLTMHEIAGEIPDSDSAADQASWLYDLLLQAGHDFE